MLHRDNLFYGGENICHISQHLAYFDSESANVRSYSNMEGSPSKSASKPACSSYDIITMMEMRCQLTLSLRTPCSYMKHGMWLRCITDIGNRWTWAAIFTCQLYQLPGTDRMYTRCVRVGLRASFHLAKNTVTSVLCPKTYQLRLPIGSQSLYRNRIRLLHRTQRNN